MLPPILFWVSDTFVQHTFNIKDVPECFMLYISHLDFIDAHIYYGLVKDLTGIKNRVIKNVLVDGLKNNKRI